MRKAIFKYILLSFLIIQSCISFSQINGYAKVTSIAGTTLNLSNVNQAAHSFTVGDLMVIMQMQDNVIGANTADNVNFGNLSAISSAGLFEITTITSINGNSTTGFTSGAPTTLTVNGLSNTYNTGANSSTQIITFRRMSAGNYTTTANISALDWDGNVGGVVAMEVPGTLTLNHNITANLNGFRGGNKSANYYIGGTSCYNTPFRANNSQHAYKGESIYKVTNATYNNARAKILNGGGGGVQINAGGGGGGNYSAGGLGGYGWNGTAAGCTSVNGGYGYGGIGLSAAITGNRIFMGGGGGGGQQNNSVATDGGDGGGIILIKANTITTSGACGGRTISANGETPPLSGNDGGGGGGAGGSIVFWVNNWSIGGSCALTISANGGNGGTINTSTHAGGGAGGQGVVIFNGPQPTTNVTTQTNNGNPGCNNNSVPCNNTAGSASGSNGDGIFIGTPNPLPIELLFFTAFPSENIIQLEWQTASEVNNDYFTVERSKDAKNWEFVTRVSGAGNSNTSINYYDIDKKPYSGISYYRLKQTDFDGKYEYSSIVAVELNKENIQPVKLYPNPSNGELTLEGDAIEIADFKIFNVLGQDVTSLITVTENNSTAIRVNILSLAKGVYNIQTRTRVTRLVKE